MITLEKTYLSDGHFTKDDTVIQLKGVNKSFGNNHVLKHVDLDLHKGESLVVLGKSGSGKSVLIKCIIGLIKPDNGSINVLGKNVTELDHVQLDELRARVGFLFQSNALYDSMTVRENLEFPLRRHALNLSREKINELVLEALNNVGLEHTIDMRPAELSGGMKKRIALARTLILKPEIILYDEPTAGLDPITSTEISILMHELSKKYKTSSIIISHDMNCVKITSDRIVVLMDGNCLIQGNYEELSNSKNPLVLNFFK